MARIRVAAASEIASGQGRAVAVPGATVALFNVDGNYYAIDNACPHRGGPLGEGDLDGRIVRCPWHGWRWDVTTGASANNPAVGVACFPVSLVEGQVFVELP